MNLADDVPYVALVASLPAPGTLLAAKAPPINRLQLEARLRWLAPADRADLDAARSLVAWTLLDTDDTDAAFVQRAERVLQTIRSETLRHAVRDRLEIRTLIAALRRRHAGEDAPPPGERWGFGRYVATIRANWTAPDFGVGQAFTWVRAAREKLEADDRMAFERIALEAAWASGARHLADHAFDLEAVAWYVLRWSLVDRWSVYDPDAAAVRFAELVDGALGAAPQPMANA